MFQMGSSTTSLSIVVGFLAGKFTTFNFQISFSTSQLLLRISFRHSNLETHRIDMDVVNPEVSWRFLGTVGPGVNL